LDLEIKSIRKQKSKKQNKKHLTTCFHHGRHKIGKKVQEKVNAINFFFVKTIAIVHLNFIYSLLNTNDFDEMCQERSGKEKKMNKRILS
jgi:hypothetical protein